MSELLGGKGANLAEMVSLGLRVPPGFTITTEACREYLTTGSEPSVLRNQVSGALAALERDMGRTLGDPADPLLVSVRSGAKFSMPGMMETVLNIGLNDSSVEGLAQIAGDPRFAWDSYRRLLQMYGKTVLDIAGEPFEDRIDAAKAREGVATDIELSTAALEQLVSEFKGIIRQETGTDFPQDARAQLDGAIHAVFDSWNTERARIYRRREHIPHDLGTAVNVQAMVFGNAGPRDGGLGSGSGVAFTRDPATGDPGVYGDYLPDAQGEDVVAGIRNAFPLTELERIDANSHAELMANMRALEDHYRDLCDIEFTVERGTLWMLQTRVGKRTAAAAFRIAISLVDEGVLTMDEAIQRVTGAQLAHLMFPRFDATADTTILARGTNASPGAAVGTVVFSSEEAVRKTAEGERVILVRRETTPEDLAGMVAATGILTSRGGKTSHAAVVARGMGKTAVCGAESLRVDIKKCEITTDTGLVIREGDTISIDGSTGEVFLGEVPVTASPIVQLFEEGLAAALAGADEETAELITAVHRIMEHADSRRRMGVRTNADTAPDAARARRMGAAGIGLCRTEHMFLGERRQLIEDLILADNQVTHDRSLEALLPLQRSDFTEILDAMDGLPVTVRLIDPPLHEFLPDRTELAVAVAVAQERGEDTSASSRVLAAVNRLSEQNPMLGLRGVRLGLVLPGLFAMQVRALAEAACDVEAQGKSPRAEIMIPLVGSITELTLITAEVNAVIAEVVESRGSSLTFPVGTMIELPRAALTASDLAESAEFFSFGTNDLTQTTWGFSRDDVEAAFFSPYLDKGIFPVSPFESIDVQGVGALVAMAVQSGRATRPGISCGVCGEHGGDPASIHFFNAVGLDYVSCSPFRVPVARLESGRASVMGDL
ncbi:MAG: pyruvate, phosphate dikinase [Candidatus Nanopelagicales bacterium]|nr:pyruvate, phosphate dikinase [Candidatus Nanopelagicales bacterium]